jgi:hypothetical protein
MATGSIGMALPSTRSHVPLLARKSAVRVALLPQGLRTKPTAQILYIGGSVATVTVDDVTSTNSYVLVIDGTYTYTYTAGSTDTKETVAYQLMKKINAGTASHGVTAQHLHKNSSDDYVFDLYKPTGSAFTVANTGTTTSGELDVSSVTNGSTAATKGATSITLLNSVTAAIQEGQYLQAVEADGDERLFQLTATVTSGTSLSVASLPEGISSGAQIIFPVELYDRSSADSSEKSDTKDFSTFNTGGKKDYVATTSGTEIKLSGNFYEGCPGFNTAKYAAANGRELYVLLQDPPYKDDWEPRYEEGAALVTARDKKRSGDGFVTNDLTFQFAGTITETPARPIG